MFEELQNIWQSVFDEYLEAQGEYLRFYLRANPTGGNIDDIWKQPLDFSGSVVDTLIEFDIRGIVFRDLYGADVSNNEIFVLQQVGEFLPGDVVAQVRISDIEDTFGGPIDIERVKYVTLENDPWDTKYMVRQIVPRGLGSPPYIADIFLRRITKEGL